MPQSPQLAALVLVSMHSHKGCSPQMGRPCTQAHVPPWHLAPGGHTVPQAPQLVELARRSVQCHMGCKPHTVKAAGCQGGGGGGGGRVVRRQQLCECVKQAQLLWPGMGPLALQLA